MENVRLGEVIKFCCESISRVSIDFLLNKSLIRVEFALVGRVTARDTIRAQSVLVEALMALDMNMDRW